MSQRVRKATLSIVAEKVTAFMKIRRESSLERPDEQTRRKLDFASTVFAGTLPRSQKLDCVGNEVSNAAQG